ncbi:MAG: hypothetical protein IJR50_04655 [Treponema sp.]|nr:hypothetical protein [Treponema sp.]
MTIFNEKEILNRAKETKSLNEYVDVQTKKYKKDISFAGLYIFWFDNSDKIIRTLKRNLQIKGPNRKTQSLSWDWNLDNEKICLYVGKSTDIKKRLGQHLLLKTNNLYPNTTSELYKKTTSCQFRSGFDYLYQKKNINIFSKINKRVHLSIIRENNFIRRFYMEDFLIGKLLPWFNIDSER